MQNITLKKIDETNFLSAFGLKLLGYGTAALQRCLEYIAKKPFGNSDRVVLTCHRENGAALALYRKFGFAETGNADDEEIELAMRVNH